VRIEVVEPREGRRAPLTLGPRQERRIDLGDAVTVDEQPVDIEPAAVAFGGIQDRVAHEGGRSIPARAQPLRQQRQGLGNALLVRPHAVHRRMAPAEERRKGRPGLRNDGHCLGEMRGASRERIDGRRREPGVAVDRQVIGAKGVGRDEEDVRGLGRRWPPRGRAAQEKGETQPRHSRAAGAAPRCRSIVHTPLAYR